MRMVENQMHEDEISLDELFRIIIKRFYVVIISLIIVISGAIIYLNHAVNQYQASIVMLVEPIRESSTIGRVLSSDFLILIMILQLKLD